jgi:hypothetical protein
VRAEHLLRAVLGDAVGERERELLGGELLDVGALDIFGLLQLNDAQNLDAYMSVLSFRGGRRGETI